MPQKIKILWWYFNCYDTIAINVSQTILFLGLFENRFKICCPIGVNIS